VLLTLKNFIIKIFKEDYFMNSLSNTNNGEKKCYDPCPPQYCNCKSHEELHPVPGSALLEIGKGYPVLINSANAPSITAAAPLVIAQVDLDPTCLCYPNLKIEFSSFLTLTGALASTDKFTIQLSRIRNGYSPVSVMEPLQTYSFTIPVTIPAGTVFSLPISFIYGEENIRVRESTYVVQVISATLVTGETGSIQFQNVNIAALAVGGVHIG
jgi:hypothetical protein